MRINQYIASAGVTSRSKADELIAEGRVKVNGKKLTSPGYHVEEGDVVEVDGARVEPAARKVYYLLNKPAGYVTSTADKQGRPLVTELVPDSVRVFPVGRLDYNTTGVGCTCIYVLDEYRVKPEAYDREITIKPKK